VEQEKRANPTQVQESPILAACNAQLVLCWLHRNQRKVLERRPFIFPQGGLLSFWWPALLAALHAGFPAGSSALSTYTILNTPFSSVPLVWRA
jgi:hypothetical protein